MWRSLRGLFLCWAAVRERSGPSSASQQWTLLWPWTATLAGRAALGTNPCPAWVWLPGAVPLGRSRLGWGFPGRESLLCLGQGRGWWQAQVPTLPTRSCGAPWDLQVRLWPPHCGAGEVLTHFVFCCLQPACLMPHWKWRVPLWSAGMEATLCIHTCLWLSTAWIPLASSDRLACSGERAPGTEARHVRLTWAVSLDAPEEELEQQAEELARTAGLVNMGRVGELKGHYLFTYQPDGHAASEPEAIRRSVDTLFAQHDSVRWHSEQKLLKRSKRSLHFNDPKYPQQWHLVSGFLAPVVPAGSGPLSGLKRAVMWQAKQWLSVLVARRKHAKSAHCNNERRWLPQLAPHRWCWGGQRGFSQSTLRGQQAGARHWPCGTGYSASWLEQLLLGVCLKQIFPDHPATPPCAPSTTPDPAPHVVASVPKRSGSPFPWSSPPALLFLSPHCPFWCLEQPQEPREGHQRHGRLGEERDGARCDGGGGG